MPGREGEGDGGGEEGRERVSFIFACLVTNISSNRNERELNDELIRTNMSRIACK